MHNQGMTGEQIKAARKALKETQGAFAARFGVDQSTIHRWETEGVPERGVTAIAVRQVLDSLPAPHPASAA